jgi:general secretion pathway protein A
VVGVEPPRPPPVNPWPEREGQPTPYPSAPAPIVPLSPDGSAGGALPGFVPPLKASPPLLALLPTSLAGAGTPIGPPLRFSPSAIDGSSDAEPPGAGFTAPADAFETFFGLNEQPFTLSTDPKYLYHGAAHDHAAQDLLSAVRRRDGLVVLTGDIGNGKTTLCRAVIEELDRRTLTSLVLERIGSVEELLRTVLVDFGVISREDIARGRLARRSRAVLLEKLREFLTSLVQLNAFAVVIIDEAQHLPVPVLQEIGSLLDLNPAEPLLQIALVGEPALRKQLRRPELRPLSKRIAVWSELGPLAVDEIVEYVMHRLTVAGARTRITFDGPAFERLHDVTGGVPRLVNLVCDRALLLGCDASPIIVDGPLILSAARALGVHAPRSHAGRLLRVALSGIVLGALMGVGASVAAWVFRAPVAAAVLRWEAVPAPPRTPVRAFPAPFTRAPTLNLSSAPRT